MKFRNFLISAAAFFVLSSFTGLNQAKSSSSKEVIKELLELEEKKGYYSNHNFFLTQEAIDDALASVEMIDLTQKWKITNEHCKNIYGLKDIFNDNFYGSAIVIKEDDKYQYLLSANHVTNYDKPPICIGKMCTPLEKCGVAEGNPKIEIKEKNIELEILIADDKLDFSYLRTKKTDKLHTFKGKIGDSSKLDIGDKIYAIGYSLGLDKLFTEGNLSTKQGSDYSHKENKIIYFEDEFSYTSPITFGNSGGPLFAIKGDDFEVVGITTMMRFGQNLNIGTKINPIMEKIKSYEKKLKK